MKRKNVKQKMQNHNLKLKIYKCCVPSSEVTILNPARAAGYGAKFGLSSLAFIFLLLLCSFTFAEPSKKAPATGKAQLPAVVEPEQSSGSVIQKVCELIYEGQSDAADKLIEKSEAEGKSSQLEQLKENIEEYKSINKRRQQARDESYNMQLVELGELKIDIDANSVDDANEANDVNSIPEIFSVITRAHEFANKQQKAELLSRDIVKKTIQKALDKAAKYESQGEWLDAYLNCYYWLQLIDPNNKAYSDYADELLDKANIVASFQDSPCETSEERFQNVDEKTLIRAIKHLRFNYVTVIDNLQMVKKALKRCEMLAEVIRTSDVVQDAVYEDANDYQEKKFTAWSAGLSEISDNLEKMSTNITEDKFEDIFEKVLKLNSQTAQLPDELLIAQFADAALSALDPYTVMVWPKQIQDFEKSMTNEFTGIGIEIIKQKGFLTVASLLPDTPAYKSGLDAEDVIEAVDGVETKDMTLSCAVDRITGPSGTKVTLTIRRKGEDKTFDIELTRAKITVPTIRGWQRTEAGKWLYMLNGKNKIGYVRITNFSEKTSSDFEEILDELEPGGLKGLILDLRFNSGGLLTSAIDIADKFLDQGPIVITRPRYWVASTYAQAHKKGTHPDYPVVVLVNRYSASASEIVAGALADKVHNRAILVGEKTHGKGSVQGIKNFANNKGQLKYTMAYYHLPSGQRVQSREQVKKQNKTDWGVKPNIKVELTSEEMRKLTDVQRDNAVLAQANHNSSGAGELKRYSIEQTLESDPQLAIALLVIKSKLVEQSMKAETKTSAIVSSSSHAIHSANSPVKNKKGNPATDKAVRNL